MLVKRVPRLFVQGAMPLQSVLTASGWAWPHMPGGLVLRVVVPPQEVRRATSSSRNGRLRDVDLASVVFPDEGTVVYTLSSRPEYAGWVDCVLYNLFAEVFERVFVRPESLEATTWCEPGRAPRLVLRPYEENVRYP